MDKKVSISTPVPLPSDWAKLHSLLSKAWKLRDDGGLPKPPVPLILAGAAFSRASDIRQRWIDLITWANEYEFSALLSRNLPEPPDHDVADAIAGVSEDGKGWWPEIGEQFHDPKQKPSKKVVAETLEHLKLKWTEIVGNDLARATSPVKFTGKKSRRLIVIANLEFTPPWGSWYSASCNPKAFSEFRKAINAAISPMEVDDIEFNTESW